MQHLFYSFLTDLKDLKVFSHSLSKKSGVFKLGDFNEKSKYQESYSRYTIIV